MNVKELLRNIPVSVNNFYRDPTLQWRNTLIKLKQLALTDHAAPVGLITKGKLTKRHCSELSQFKQLKLVVLVSISELPIGMEKVSHVHRYRNIELLNQSNIPNIAYIRPLTPPYNSGEKVVNKIFRNIAASGANAAMVCGFRGSDAMVSEFSPSEAIKWTLRVKQMTPDIWANVYRASQENGIQLFMRTSCAVDYVLGHKSTYNPYYNAPKLAKCVENSCPLIETCRPPSTPKQGSIEFLRSLGYELEFQSGTLNRQICNVEPHNRLECKSCCTTCFNLENPRIFVYGDVQLGDLTFIRFITGMIAMQPGCRDTGGTNIGQVHLPSYPGISNIICLNSWWAYASVGEKCFDCKYCIEKHYATSHGTDIGLPPVQLLEKLL